MRNEDPWFFEERAIAFASLVLTKHHDIIVKAHAGTDIAVDLIGEVRKNGRLMRPRLFGVQIVPYMDLPDIENAGERELSHFSENHFEAEFPICVFVIGVRKPEGIYRWGVEPVIEEGRAKLRRDAARNWLPLNEAGVARLIEKVNDWYDAGLEISKPTAPERHTKTGAR